MNLKLLTLFIGMAVAVCLHPLSAKPLNTPAGAKNQHAEKLDDLFASLHSTKDPADGNRLVNRIWMLWHQSGNRKIDDLLTRAGINVSEGELSAALEKYDEIIRRAPHFAEGWNRRATLLFQLGKLDRSLADIIETLKREPRHFGALAGRGLIYSVQGRTRDALQAFMEAIKHNPFLKRRHNIIRELRKRLGERKI